MLNIEDHNWEIVSHIFGAFTSYNNGILHNISLHPELYDALKFALYHKYFCPKGRFRKDDSLIKAIGNWLYSKEYGAWRNTNAEYEYKSNNKIIWQSFQQNVPDYSMSKAVLAARD